MSGELSVAGADHEHARGFSLPLFLAADLLQHELALQCFISLEVSMMGNVCRGFKLGIAVTWLFSSPERELMKTGVTEICLRGHGKRGSVRHHYRVAAEAAIPRPVTSVFDEHVLDTADRRHHQLRDAVAPLTRNGSCAVIDQDHLRPRRDSRCRSCPAQLSSVTPCFSASPERGRICAS